MNRLPDINLRLRGYLTFPLRPCGLRAHSAAWFMVAGAILSAFSACDGKQPTAPNPVRAVAPVAEQRSLGPIAFVSDRDGAKAIYLANSDGSGATRLTSGERPAWAPGGRQLAFQRADGIYVINADGSGEARVTAGSVPAWSPDGRTIVFSSTDGSLDVMDVDGSGARQLVNPAMWNSASADYGAYWPSWSPDGRRIAFIRTSYDDAWALFVVDVNGTTAPRRVVVNTAEHTSWSPDGSKIAFGAGGGAVGVVAADGSAPGTVETSGYYADWTPTGSLIFNDFTGPGDASNRLGSRMRVFLSTSSIPLIAEAIAPVRPDYWDQQAAWAR